MIEKLLVDKFKQQLGSQYEVCGNDFFEENFTKPIPTQIGQYQQLIQYDAFERYKDKIVAVVQVQPAQYAVSISSAINTSYTLTLWVPVNYKQISSKGEFLQAPKFNVDKDLKDLREALNNKTIDFECGYRGELTFSEPVPVGNGYDNSGSYKRKLLTVSGKANLTTSGYLGRDYKVELGSLDDEDIEYHQVKELATLLFSTQPTPVENHEQGELTPESNVEAVKQACLFKVGDNSNDEVLDDLFTRLALSGERSAEMYMLKVSKLKSGEYVEYVRYPVYLDVSLSYEFGDSDVGVFTVSCSRSKN